MARLGRTRRGESGRVKELRIRVARNDYHRRLAFFLSFSPCLMNPRVHVTCIRMRNQPVSRQLMNRPREYPDASRRHARLYRAGAKVAITSPRLFNRSLMVTRMYADMRRIDPLFLRSFVFRKRLACVCAS